MPQFITSLYSQILNLLLLIFSRCHPQKPTGSIDYSMANIGLLTRISTFISETPIEKNALIITLFNSDNHKISKSVCSSWLNARTNPIAHPAAALPTTTIWIPPQQALLILFPPRHPIIMPVLVYPNVKSARTITPIEIYSPLYTSLLPTHK